MSFAQALTLDQLRVVLAIAETGSFSDAAAQLNRTQGSISYNVSNIEAQLDLRLFERTARRPRITPAGRLIVHHARVVLGRLDQLRAAAQRVRAGVEPEVALALDVLLPTREVTELVCRFQERWPAVPLRLTTDVLGDVVAHVVEGRCDLGIVGAHGLPEHLARSPCGAVELVPVAAPTHPLAALDRVDDLTLEDHVHLVFAGGGESMDLLGVSRGIKWRLTDMGLRLALLRAGLGWARMPRDRVQMDLDTGALVALKLQRWAGVASTVDFAVIHDPSRPPGPVGLWLQATAGEVMTAGPTVTASRVGAAVDR